MKNNFSELGKVINDRYQVMAMIGKGGMGITYHAKDLQTNTNVALKSISLKQVNDWKQIELIEREASVLQQLNHPAIPQYLDYFQVDKDNDRFFYIIQELVEGKSLDKWVQQGWRIDEQELKNIAKQILNILIYLHQQKPPIIHRDIKPQNLIRNEAGKIFLVDFGAVQNAYYNTIAKGSTMVGTYGYMPLEQSSGQVTPASDLYSTGATLLYLLTHRSPSELDDDSLSINVAKCLENNNLSQGIINWLEKMLESDVDDRFQTAEEALLVLDKPHLIKKEKKNRKNLLKGSIAILFLGVTGFFLTNNLVENRLLYLSYLGYYPQEVCPFTPESPTKISNLLNDDKNIPLVVKVVNKNPSCFITLERNSNLKIIKLLIKNGLDINTKTQPHGKALLHQVTNIEIAKLLIENGADVNVKDDDGNTPLHDSRDIKISKLLIENGANVNARDSNGNTLLHDPQDIAIIRLLIENGANVNAQNNNSDTPLHDSRDIEISKLLIENGADVNARNQYGSTPLHHSWDFEISQLLVENGADINTKNNHGDTPFDSNSLNPWEITLCTILAIFGMLFGETKK